MLCQLKSFMFTLNNLNQFSNIAEEEKNSGENKSSSVIKDKDKELFIPKYKDTLFWCFYIIHNGLNDYYLIGNQSFKIEKETKIACIENLRTRKELLKKNKWKRTSIETDLLNNPVISPTTFICLCALYDIDITIVEDGYYYTWGEKTSNIVKKDGDEYGLYNGSNDNIEKILSRYWKITSIKKPLRGVSSYKVGELKKICKQLGLSIYKSEGRGILNKKDIYNLIKAKIE